MVSGHGRLLTRMIISMVIRRAGRAWEVAAWPFRRGDADADGIGPAGGPVPAPGRGGRGGERAVGCGRGGRAAYALWAMADAFRHGRVGVDVIAVLAVAGALAVGELLAAAVISVMLASGRALEAWAAGRARRDLRALLERAPRTARRYRAGPWRRCRWSGHGRRPAAGGARRAGAGRWHRRRRTAVLESRR